MTLALTLRPASRQTLGRWQIARKLEIERDLMRLRGERVALALEVAHLRAAQAREAAEILALMSRRGKCRQCGEPRCVARCEDGRRRCRTCREYRGMP